MAVSTAPYHAWPNADDVTARLASVGVSLRGDTGTQAGRISSLLLAVIAEVEQETKRQFVPDSVDVTKTYDGSGSPELEIDPILSITSVRLVAGYGTPATTYDVSSVQIIEETGKPRTRLVVGQGSLPAYATAMLATAVYYLFPVGRRNVQITGRFGYAASIPADLWEAVCGEIARRATSESLFTSGGRLVEEAYGDERRKYQLDDANGTGWQSAFMAAVARYKRPNGAARRKRSNQMI